MSKILVTGAGAGLGKHICQALRRYGQDVFEFDRKRGHDVRDPKETLGPPPLDLDVLINCAGIRMGRGDGHHRKGHLQNDPMGAA